LQVMTMRIQELWRYPVKSMAGERLESAELHDDGIAGDRTIVVMGAHGRIVSARSHPKLLGHRATLSPDGTPLVDGRPWDSPEVARDVEAAAGAGARLVSLERDPDRFDVLPLLVATDGAIAAFGHDGRRLRPNIVLSGVEGLAEREWEGREIRVGAADGAAIIRLVSLRERCIMTTYDPDTLEQDVDVFRKIRSEFGGTLALNAEVVRGGRLETGMPVV
jgi:uncharacterized protein YcbX